MAKQTTICTDPETRDKLHAMAPGGNVSAYLREIANNGSRLPSPTIYDLLMEVQELRREVIEKISQIANKVVR